jgi:hypothetical protein
MLRRFSGGRRIGERAIEVGRRTVEFVRFMLGDIFEGEPV